MAYVLCCLHSLSEVKFFLSPKPVLETSKGRNTVDEANIAHSALCIPCASFFIYKTKQQNI